jgi:hypothetical protein
MLHRSLSGDGFGAPWRREAAGRFYHLGTIRLVVSWHGQRPRRGTALIIPFWEPCGSASINPTCNICLRSGASTAPPGGRYGAFETYCPAQDRRSLGGHDRVRDRLGCRPQLSARRNEGGWGGCTAINPHCNCGQCKPFRTGASPGRTDAPDGACAGTRTGAELGRTDTPDHAGAGTCSGSDAASLGYDRANSRAADRRSGACAEATATGCRAHAGASAADRFASGSHDVAGTDPHPHQTHVGCSTHRRELGNGRIVPLSSDATRASLCARQLRTRYSSNDAQGRHNLGSRSHRIWHTPSGRLSVLQTGSCPQALFRAAKLRRCAVNEDGSRIG